MSSRQTQEEDFIHKADQIVGQPQMMREECVERTTWDENSSQPTGFLQQTGERVKSMAHGAAETVKNTLGLNSSSQEDNSYNKKPTDLKNPNKTTCPSLPGHPPSTI